MAEAEDLQGQDGGEDQDLQTFIENLEQLRHKYQTEGNYEEAHNIKLRLHQLRDDVENRRRKELRDQQLAERLGVEEAHMKELQEFNEIWDRKVAEFEAHAQSLQQQLDARHKADLAAYMQKAQAETAPTAPRWSKELLNLRRIQEMQAKTKSYDTAHKTKSEADQLEAKEHALWKAKRDLKLQTLEEQFKNKQNLEMAGLVKRIQSGREEQKQCRRSELERLLQRYHNVKAQLESQQKIIRERRERAHGHAQSMQLTPMTSSVSRPQSRSGYPVRQRPRSG